MTHFTHCPRCGGELVPVPLYIFPLAYQCVVCHEIFTEERLDIIDAPACPACHHAPMIAFGMNGLRCPQCHRQWWAYDSGLLLPRTIKLTPPPGLTHDDP